MDRIGHHFFASILPYRTKSSFVAFMLKKETEEYRKHATNRQVGMTNGNQLVKSIEKIIVEILEPPF
jgi:hypothetical protein